MPLLDQLSATSEQAEDLSDVAHRVSRRKNRERLSPLVRCALSTRDQNNKPLYEQCGVAEVLAFARLPDTELGRKGEGISHGTSRELRIALAFRRTRAGTYLWFVSCFMPCDGERERDHNTILVTGS